MSLAESFTVAVGDVERSRGNRALVSVLGRPNLITLLDLISQAIFPDLNSPYTLICLVISSFDYSLVCSSLRVLDSASESDRPLLLPTHTP
jgi:hypothetical protein